jgi:hypothetical protein
MLEIKVHMTLGEGDIAKVAIFTDVKVPEAITVVVVIVYRRVRLHLIFPFEADFPVIVKFIGPGKTKAGGRVFIVNEFDIIIISIVAPEDGPVDLPGNFKIQRLRCG